MSVDYWVNLEPEACYHIYNRSVGNAKLFLKEEDYTLFLKTWEKYLSKYLSAYAYCLIPNHFHFLIKCRKPDHTTRKFIELENTVKGYKYLNDEISYNDFIASQFKRFFNSYSTTTNIQRKRTGALWQKKFKRIWIRDEEHFRFMLLYIHHNGIHHNLVNNYVDWPYSSFHDYLAGVSSTLLSDDPAGVRQLVTVATNAVLPVFSDQGTEKARQAFLEFHEAHKNGLGGYPNLKKLKAIAID